MRTYSYFWKKKIPDFNFLKKSFFYKLKKNKNRKGALLLFSEEILANKKEKSYTESTQTEENLNSPTKEKRKFDSNSLSDMPMRTVNDLQRNILFYGMPNEVFKKKYSCFFFIAILLKIY